MAMQSHKGCASSIRSRFLSASSLTSHSSWNWEIWIYSDLLSNTPEANSINSFLETIQIWSSLFILLCLDTLEIVWFVPICSNDFECLYEQVDWPDTPLFGNPPHVFMFSPGPLAPFAPWSSELPVPAVLDTRDVAAALLAVKAAAPGPRNHQPMPSGIENLFTPSITMIRMKSTFLARSPPLIRRTDVDAYYGMKGHPLKYTADSQSLKQKNCTLKRLECQLQGPCIEYMTHLHFTPKDAIHRARLVKSTQAVSDSFHLQTWEVKPATLFRVS